MLDPLSVNIPLGTPVSSRPNYPTRKLLQPSPSHPDDYILEWDYSSMSNFMICPRKSENYNVRHREADKSNSPTEFGTLFHKIEEVRRLNGYTDDIKAKHEKMIDDHFLANPVAPGDHRTADRMRSVLRLYYEKFSADGIEAKVYRDEHGPYVERPFKVELCTIPVNGLIPYPPLLVIVNAKTDNRERGFPVRNIHIVYTGRIDMVLEEAGNLWVWDDKTTSRAGKEFKDAFRLSLQTRGYTWVVNKILQRQIMGAIINGVIIRPLTKTGTGTEFDQFANFYSEDSLSEFEDNVKAHASDFVNCLVRGYFPQTSSSYKSPCIWCDYAENCCLPREQRAADLASALYRDVTWNPMH